MIYNEYNPITESFQMKDNKNNKEPYLNILDEAIITYCEMESAFGTIMELSEEKNYYNILESSMIGINESGITNFFQAIITGIKTLANKTKDFFNKAETSAMSTYTSSKSNVDKMANKVSNNDSIEIEGYEFHTNNISLTMGASGIYNDISTKISDYDPVRPSSDIILKDWEHSPRNSPESVLASYETKYTPDCTQGKAHYNPDNTWPPEGWKDELRKQIYGDKKTITISAKSCIDVIAAYDKKIKGIHNMEKLVSNNLSKTISSLEAAEKSLSTAKESDISEFTKSSLQDHLNVVRYDINFKLKYYREEVSMNNLFIGFALQACKDEYTQAKSALTKIWHNTNDKND